MPQSHELNEINRNLIELSNWFSIEQSTGQCRKTVVRAETSESFERCRNWSEPSGRSVMSLHPLAVTR